MSFLLATKEEMSQLFTEDGGAVPVTALRAGPVTVTQLKETDRDGYRAVQLGFGEQKRARTTKSEHGHMQKALAAAGYDASTTAFRYLREAPLDPEQYSIGDKIDVTAFEEGQTVTVVGVIKGKGYQGGVKRHGFTGAKESSHGTKHANREIGAIGAMGPQRVFKGKKMPGRMGADRVTVPGLTVAAIDSEQNILYVKGAVPGKKGGLVEVSSSA